MPQRCPYDRDGRTWAEAIALALGRRAIRGDVQAARELGDRTEGRPAQSLQLSGSLDMAANMTIEEIDARLEKLLSDVEERDPALAAKMDAIQKSARNRLNDATPGPVH
jgi:hypothetical protein